MHCALCIERLARRAHGYVRLSCLNCWLLERPNRRSYRCEYGKGLVSMVTREAESRRMETSAPGVLVTRRVRWFYDHDSDINHAFGRWELFSHNCEDFARFCKILKQAIGVVATVALAASIVRTVGASWVIKISKSTC